MKLYVDGESRDLPPGGGSVLGELMAEMRGAAAREGRAVTTVKLEGEEILPDAEAEAASVPLGDIEKLEIETAPAAEWGRHGLGEASSALGQLADEFRSIADLLRGGDRVQSLERFQHAVAGYGQIVQALVNAAALAGVSAPVGFQECVEAVTGAMKEMAPALKAEDAVAAADHAEYELADRLEELGAMVKEMSGA